MAREPEIKFGDPLDYDQAASQKDIWIVLERGEQRWAGLCQGRADVRGNPLLILVYIHQRFLKKNRRRFQAAWKGEEVETPFPQRFRKTDQVHIYEWTNPPLRAKEWAEAMEGFETVQEARRQRRKRRRAYTGVRDLFSSERDNKNVYLSLLELDESVTLEEFRVVRKRVMYKWHPDRKPAWEAEGNDPDEFDRLSVQYLDAISWVTNFLQDRE